MGIDRILEILNQEIVCKEMLLKNSNDENREWRTENAKLKEENKQLIAESIALKALLDERGRNNGDRDNE